jgi:hypothetical protein
MNLFIIFFFLSFSDDLMEVDETEVGGSKENLNTSGKSDGVETLEKVMAKRLGNKGGGLPRLLPQAIVQCHVT